MAKLKVAIIGLGGRARDIARTCFEVPLVQIVAICDCFKPAVNSFHKELGKDRNWTDYEDFRQMIDKEKQARTIGYGAMLIEGLVGIIALIAAAVERSRSVSSIRNSIFPPV